ncbi:MAG: hypothetical protein V4607_11195 [Pseudomonadota bacterium]
MSKPILKIYFSDFFGVPPEKIEEYGAFNISLLTDLPLFIDPFLLFSSSKPEYQKLHKEIIEYVKFLKTQSSKPLDKGLIEGWFHFPEIKQNWFGYSKGGNFGRGLGPKFASSLKLNLTTIFQNFGEETDTAPHLEKLTLVKNGVGKDQISDLTCNLITQYLCEYTESFAKKNIAPEKLKKFMVKKVRFDKKTSAWVAQEYLLPKHGKDFVILTPTDMLTKDSNWINHQDLVEDFSSVVEGVSNTQLRAQVDYYFASVLPTDPTKEEIEAAVEKVIKKYPELLDVFIALKEKDDDGAKLQSAEKIAEAQEIFVTQLKNLVDRLYSTTDFYKIPTSSYEEAVKRISFLKHVIEAEDGYRLFYLYGKPIKREAYLQIIFKLTWFASEHDVNAEVNNGRGPADFIVSYGSKDKTVIEFKLASNTSLEKNLIKQAEIYADASRSTHAPLKVILFFSETERMKILELLKKHNLSNSKDIFIIDATPQKVSASKA